MDLDRTLTGGLVVDGTGARAYRADVGIRRGASRRSATSPRPRRGSGSTRAAASSARASSTCTPIPICRSCSARPATARSTRASRPRSWATAGSARRRSRRSTPRRCDRSTGSSAASSTTSTGGGGRTASSRTGWARAASGSTSPRWSGHVTVRAAVMGYAQRPPSAAELAAMQDLVRAAMRDGCFGLSTGLVYPPGAYADTEEVVELARVAGEAGGLYASHIRGEGHSLLRAVAEAIEIGERAGARVQISHHKAAFRPYWGRIRHATRLSEWAQERGQDVTFDVYPYTAGSAPLTQIVPDWAHEGGLDALVGRLRTPADRARLAREIAEQGREWDQTLVAWMPDGPGKADEGSSIADIAARRGADPVETLLALLEESSAPRDDGPLRHERGRRPPRDATSARHVRVGRAGADAARAAGRGQAASPLLRHVSAHPRPLRPGDRASSRSRPRSTRRPTGRQRSSGSRPRGGSRSAPTRTWSCSIRPRSRISRRTPIRIASRRASSTCWWPGR